MAVALDLDEERPAAHRQCRRAGAQRHGVILLAQLAADIAQQAARRAHRQLAGAALRVINELIDREIGIGADRHRRFIEKHELGLPGFAGGDAFVEDDVLADHQPARRRAWRRPGRIGIDCAADPDPLLGERSVRTGEQKQAGDQCDTKRQRSETGHKRFS